MRSLRTTLTEAGASSARALLGRLPALYALEATASLGDALWARELDAHWRAVDGPATLGRPTTHRLERPGPTLVRRDHTSGRVGVLSGGVDGDATAETSRLCEVVFDELYCEKEVDSSNPFEGGSDEPYALVYVLAAGTLKPVVHRFGAWSDVDSGEPMVVAQPVHSGVADELRIGCVLMDQNFGNPDEAKKSLQDALDEGVALGAAVVGVIVPPDWAQKIPGVGKALGALAKLLGMEDETIGEALLTVGTTDFPLPPEGTSSWVSQGTQCVVTGHGARYVFKFSIRARYHHAEIRPN